MSTPTFGHLAHDSQPQPTAPTPYQRRGTGRVAVAIYAGIAGLVVGFAAAIGGETTPVEATPSACKTALHESDRLIELLATGFTYSADAMEAVGRFDVAGVEESTRKLRDLRPEVEQRRDAYDSAKGRCLAK